MRTLQAILFFTFISLQSQASISGSWSGWGSWAFRNEQDSIPCNLMKMRWTENEKRLSLAHGFYDCEVVRMEIDPISWQKVGQDLFDENDTKVGTYDGQNLDIKIQSPVENTMIHIKIKREANHFDYRETWFNSDEKVYIIKGRLFTQ